MELNQKSITERVEKSWNSWKLNNINLNNTCVKEVSRENLKRLEPNENKNTTHQNVLDATKAVLRGKFVALNAHIRKEDRSKSMIKDFTLGK